MRWFSKLFIVLALVTSVALAQNLGPPSGAAGSGTVTSVTCFGTAITSSGTCATAAAKSDQQAATSNTFVVTPSQQQSHPSAAKAWLSIGTCTTTCTPLASYNVSSVVRNSQGNYTVSFTTPFSSTTYACVTALSASTFVLISTKAAGNIIIVTQNSSGAATDGAYDLACFGGQ